jgi:hypothetical protein
MKATTLKKAALAAGSLSFLAGSAFSQSAVSGAGGYETLTIRGGGKFTTIGLRLHEPQVVSGTFDAQTADSLSDTDVDFTDVLTAGTRYLVEITGGTSSEGTVIEVDGWNGNDLTGLSGIVADDATDYTIRAAKTINDVFGADNSLGLSADTTGGGGDSVGKIYVPDGAGFKSYSYIDLGAGVFQGWADNLLAPAGDIALNYVDAIIVNEPGAADLSLVVTGMVKTSPTILPVDQLFTYVGTVYPTGSNLGNSGLSASLAADTTGGGGGDSVYVPKADASGYDRYQYIDLGAGVFQGWADNLLGPADDVPLTSGIVIDQNGTGAAYNAKAVAPDFYANL